MNIVKQYGLERSGTNYLKALLELNIDNIYVLSNAWGPKHLKYVKPHEFYNPLLDKNVITDPDIMTPKFIEEINYKLKENKVLYIISIKHPIDWIVSFRRFMLKHRLYVDTNIEYLVERWNTINRQWISSFKYYKFKYYIFYYSDIISGPEIAIIKFSEVNNLNMKPIFTQIINEMIEGVDIPGERNISDNPFYFKGHDGLITKDEIKYVNHFADFELLKNP